MTLKTVKYMCYGCHEHHTVRIKVDELPRRTVTKTCPKCHKRRRHHIAGPRPLTRKDVIW